MNVQHSSATNAWGTPSAIIELARTVLGRIDFDPASDWRFNATVRAEAILTSADDGLVAPWPERQRVFCNPPGGKRKNKSLTALFWQRLMAYRETGHLRHAIFMAFSLEAMQTTQSGPGPWMGHFPLCVPRKRIAFVTPEGVPGDAPSHSNTIVYVPGSEDRTAEFARLFSELGGILIPSIPSWRAA